MHPYYSVYHFSLAYSSVIKPLPDKPQWPHVDLGFKVLPPLSKRGVGRQRKKIEFLAAWSTRETNLEPKECGRFSVGIAFNMDIGLHHQSAQ